VRNARLFWRFFVPCALLLVLTSGAVGWFASRRLADIRLEDQEQALVSKALLLAERARPVLSGAASEAELHTALATLGARTGLRMTVVRADGRVVADSGARDLSAVGQHGVEREELREALVEPQGVSLRRSDTTQEMTQYVAVRVEEAGKRLGWARVARSVAAREAAAGEVRGIVLGATVGALLVGLLAAYLLAQRVVKPVRMLTDAVSAMAAGDPSRRVRAHGGRELGDLAIAYNRMADELGARMRDLAAERGELEAVLTAMVEGVLAIDEGERIVLMNAAGGRILGLVPEEVQGRPLWEVVRLREVAETLAAALKDGAPKSSEIRRPGRPHDRVLRLHASPSSRTTGPRGAVLVFHDITELRQLEQVRRDFVANASHELKTPLTAIRGLVETILDDEAMDPATQRRFLGNVLAQSQRLGDLVEEMLSLSRLEAEGARLERAPLDLRAPIEEAVEPLLPLARERGLTLDLELPEEPLEVLGAHEPLRRIVANLAGNALKYTPSGGHVVVRAMKVGARGVLEVQDTGPGIPASERERVFERFYRLDKGRSRDTGGTGLGLAIVKHLVQGLGGQVSVGDAPGGGALLRVALPLA
jgi:two-component system, OmpR family, phosphate regulon sensor histidine kinase PhoR